MEDAVDDAAEHEFEFRFTQPDKGGLHEIFEALKEFGAGIELVSCMGIVWTPKDSENLLVRYFGKPGEVHTARAKSAKEAELYRSVLESFPEYIEYCK